MEFAGNSRMPWRAFALTWIGVSTLLILTSLARIAGREFFDPDDFLRLVEVRDLIGGQHWFDLTQYRLDPPVGTPMHWSRLVDAPLALVILALRPLLGQYNAETVALVLVPMVTLGCVMALAMRIAARFFAAETVLLTGMCATLVPATLAQLNPLRIDHHGWQIACVMLAAAAPVIIRDLRKAAALSGLAMAWALTISIEGLPLAAAYGAILAVGWLLEPERGGRFVSFMAALALGLAGLYLATRGPWASTAWCDTIRPAHIAFFLLVAAISTAAARFGPATRGFVLAALAGSAIAGAALFAAIAPQCLGAPMNLLDPLVVKFWYNNIAEGMPAWRQGGLLVAVSGIPAVLAGLAINAIRVRASGAERRFWNEYLAFFVASAIAGTLVWRSIAFTGALGSLGLGWLLYQVLVWAREDRTAGARGRLPWRYITLASAIAMLGAVLLWPAGTDANGSAHAARSAGISSDCDLPQSAALLDRLPAQTVFAPLDIGPTILETSHHSVVASNHHRANLAIRDVIEAFLADPARARTIIARHGATLLVYCSAVTEPGNYVRAAPRGLMAQLEAGHPPAWLQPVDLGGPKSLRIYRIVRQP